MNNIEMDSWIDGKMDEMVKQRRDFHKYAESGWVEYRTSSIVRTHLEELGYTVHYGPKLFKEGSRLGVPPMEKLKEEEKRAIEQGANPDHVKDMEGGNTGVIAELDTGKEGPTIGLRFDIDSNDGVEASDDTHRPQKEGFVSVNKGYMHCCGHDGHTTIGMTVASLLMEVKDQLTGKIRLIFQPAEEGVRGASSMVAGGWLDDVDYFLSGHIGFVLETLGEVILDARGFLATTKYDVEFTGRNAHAGADPQEGKNAVLAACTATLNMQSFLQHSGGASRLNVGTIEGGTGRNVVPDHAKIIFEVAFIVKLNEIKH